MESVMTKENQQRLTKKELLKIKKEEKKKKKAEVDKLVQHHIDICMKFLDDAYAEVMCNLEEANNQLLIMSDYLVQEKLKLQKAVKANDLDLIEELAENSAEVTEEFILRFTRLIVPTRKNSVAEPLAKGGEQASKYLNNLIEKLERQGHKNALYIAQLITNQIRRRASEYADLTCEDFYVDNAYMTMFSEALHDYTEYLEDLRALGLKDSFEVEEVEVEDKKLKKIVSNSRLRCTHSDMMNFAKAMGYEENRQTNTTHRIWKHKETGISMPIPAKGNRTLPQGTMSRILKQMNLTRKDLAEFLGK